MVFMRKYRFQYRDEWIKAVINFCGDTSLMVVLVFMKLNVSVIAMFGNFGKSYNL